MEPTNKLRFVKREHQFVRDPNFFGKQQVLTGHHNILQQLWEEREWASDQWIVVHTEWKDVPIEEETK